MIAITEGREIRVLSNEPWEIRDGYLVLSLHDAKALRNILDFDKADLFESEPEDG